MPVKLRQLKNQLLEAGFTYRQGKGSHTVWSHAKLPGQAIPLAGNESSQSTESFGETAMNHPYSMLFRWSDEDHVYVVALPEFDQNSVTHSETYVEAARQGVDALETLIEHYQGEGLPLPELSKFSSTPAMAASGTTRTNQSQDIHNA
jgi:predicted RNase H-like HicB family nuclease/predicted RNA binding protein YcfA (HicA-like mRNA interferase family)